MLNMLVAIMGDTFAQVTENKLLNSTKTKLKLLDDYTENIKSDPTEKDKHERYLFVVQTEMDEEEQGESWEGSVN